MLHNVYHLVANFIKCLVMGRYSGLIRTDESGETKPKQLTYSGVLAIGKENLSVDSVLSFKPFLKGTLGRFLVNQH